MEQAYPADITFRNLKWRGWGFGSRLKLYAIFDFRTFSLYRYPCWVKTSLAICFNRVHTAMNKRWYSIECSIDQIQSRIKTIPCVHRQSNPNKA